jgi:hypothetical protein
VDTRALLLAFCGNEAGWVFGTMMTAFFSLFPQYFFFLCLTLCVWALLNTKQRHYHFIIIALLVALFQEICNFSWFLHEFHFSQNIIITDRFYVSLHFSQETCNSMFFI